MGDLLVNLTVLLAAYNGEKYLPELLSSLSGQTFRDFQILYQDDGSSDRTPEILSHWSSRDPRFRPAGRQGEHLGPAGNFLSLLAQSTGDLVFLCDQDDYWEPEKLDVLVRYYAEITGTRSDDPSNAVSPLLIHSDASVVDESGQMIHPSFFQHQGWDPEAVSLNRLLVQNNATGCLMMLNRPLVDLVSAYGAPSRMFMHDWFIALTAASFGSIRFCNQPLVRYRQHGDNSIGASSRSLFRRGLRALGQREKSKARIALTYSHAEAFRASFGSTLPAEAAETIDRYLAIRSLPKLQRIRQYRRMNFLMQSPITRLGQYMFG